MELLTPAWICGSLCCLLILMEDCSSHPVQGDIYFYSNEGIPEKQAIERNPEYEDYEEEKPAEVKQEYRHMTDYKVVPYKRNRIPFAEELKISSKSLNSLADSDEKKKLWKNMGRLHISKRTYYIGKERPLFSESLTTQKSNEHLPLHEINVFLDHSTMARDKKRINNCMRKCMAQGLLHPAQCHSLC